MSRFSVLVADDNEPMRTALVEALHAHFMVHRPVANGRQLVEAALSRRPDVIVTDVWMPVLNGIEAMRALRALGRKTPFVMVSADIDVGPDCLEEGAAAFVCKTNVERDLVAAVVAALDGRAFVPASLGPAPPAASAPRRAS